MTKQRAGKPHKMWAVIRIVEETLKNKGLKTVTGKACSNLNMEL